MTGRMASMALAFGRGELARWASSGRATADAARTAPFAFDGAALAEGDATALAAAMREARHAGRDIRVLHVALASPWTSPRLVDLPPMRVHEARAVLARDAARHFPVVRSEPVVAARAVSRGHWMASDADGVVLDAIVRAAREAGFETVRLAPAVGAWAHAAPNASGRIFVVDDEAAVLHTRRGAITTVRRCRAADLDAATGATDALALAARHAPWSTEPEFVSAHMQRRREQAATSLARRLVWVGAAALILAAAMQVRGVQRHEARLAEQRAALGPAIAPFMAVRDSLTRASDMLGALSRVGASTPIWGRRLWNVTAALPHEAYLTSWRGEGDSVVVEGRALDAVAVLERLRGIRGVVGVRATSTTIAVDDEAGQPVAFGAVLLFREGEAR